MSRSESRPRTPRRRRTRVLALIAAVVVLLAIVWAILWATVLPNASVADADTTLTIGDQNAPVSVTVPSGWVVERAPLPGDTLTMRSPDGLLTLTVTATAADVEAAFAVASHDAGDVGTPLTESLGSGHLAMHGLSDKALAAAVGTPDTGRSATVIVRVSADGLVDYLPAVGHVLDGLRVAS